MTVDISKIKVGDVVGVRVLRAVVPIPCVHPGSVTVADGWGGEAIINPSAIVSHTPAPRPALKAGDRVRLPAAAGRERTVIWIAENRVWLAPLPSMDSAPVFDISDAAQWERV